MWRSKIYNLFNKLLNLFLVPGLLYTSSEHKIKQIVKCVNSSRYEKYDLPLRHRSLKIWSQCKYWLSSFLKGKNLCCNDKPNDVWGQKAIHICCCVCHCHQYSGVVRSQIEMIHLKSIFEGYQATKGLCLKAQSLDTINPE